MSWSSQKKKEGIFGNVYLFEEIFLTFVFYLNVECIEYTFRIHILLHIKKHYFIHLVFKVVESLSCILKNSKFVA